MKNLFNRTDSQTVALAVYGSIIEFLEFHKDLTTVDILTKAYHSIRKDVANKALSVSKENLPLIVVSSSIIESEEKPRSVKQIAKGVTEKEEVRVVRKLVSPEGKRVNLVQEEPKEFNSTFLDTKQNVKKKEEVNWKVEGKEILLNGGTIQDLSKFSHVPYPTRYAFYQRTLKSKK